MTDSSGASPAARPTPFTYLPGEWAVLVRHDVVAALPGDSSPDTISSVWDALADDAGIATLLPLVTGGFGAGLAAMPPFALISTADGLHAILRGPVTLTVSPGEGSGAAAEQQVFSGRRVTTWAEHLLEAGAFSGFSLDCGDSTGAASELPLVAGVVRAASLTTSLTTRAAAADQQRVAAVGPASAPSSTPPESPTSPGSAVDGTAAVEPDDDLMDTIHPGLYLTSVPPDLADPGVVSEAEPLAPLASSGGSAAAQRGASAADSSFDSLFDTSEDPAPASVDSGAAPTARDTADASGTGRAGRVGPAARTSDVVTSDAGTSDPATSDAETSDHGASDSGSAGPAPSGTSPGASVATHPAIGDRAASPPTAGDPVEPPSGTTPSLADHAVEDEGTSGVNYDHLWGQTVAHRVEDAAVREAEDAPTLGPSPSGAAAPPTDPGTAVPGSTPETDSDPGTAPAGAGTPGTGQQQDDRPGSSAPPTVLIDSVPWARPRPADTAPSAGDVAVGRDPASPEPSTPGSSAGEQSDVGPLATGEGADTGDHDGHTVMRSELGVAQPAAPSAPTSAKPAEHVAGTGPVVLARLCIAGHANTPTSSSCAVCGAAVQPETQQVPRPTLGLMRVSTGEVIDLDRSIVVGRQPSVSRVQGKEMPKLVQVHSETGDISRSHVEVRLDGWHVLLVDLKATNGTVLIRDGQPPRRLGQGESAFLLDGDIAQLGDDVSLRFEDLP